MREGGKSNDEDPARWQPWLKHKRAKEPTIRKGGSLVKNLKTVKLNRIFYS